MGGNILTFADLIAPTPRETFFAESWETAPYHLRRSDSDFYRSLVTNRDIESAVSSGGLRFPAIQLAKNGAFFPAEAFTKSIQSGGEVFSGIPNLDRIRAEYRSGATISLPGFHRAWEPLGVLAAAIEDEFDHPVHTNVYITPGNAAGFSPHYDTHEVFVLQIAGEKHWRIYEPPIKLPHRSQPFSPHNYVPSGVPLEVDLIPGDLLYLPRGFVHTTSTSDSASVHVTLGITVYTWVELLAVLLRSSRSSARLRRALPPGFASRDGLGPMLKEQLVEAATELLQTADYDRLLADFSQRVKSAKASVRSGFSSDVKASR
jgi:Cupin superfamily protein